MLKDYSFITFLSQLAIFSTLIFFSTEAILTGVRWYLPVTWILGYLLSYTFTMQLAYRTLPRSSSGVVEHWSGSWSGLKTGLKCQGALIGQLLAVQPTHSGDACCRITLGTWRCCLSPGLQTFASWPAMRKLNWGRFEWKLRLKNVPIAFLCFQVLIIIHLDQ